MRNWFRALLCLLLLQTAACTAVPITAPVTGPLPATRTSIPVFSTRQKETQAPKPANTLLLRAPAATPAPPLETEAVATASAAPSVAPVLPTISPPQAGLGQTATPVLASASFRQPWQYFSGTFLFQGPLIYRLRYPIGWYALRGEGGAAVLQNFPAGEGETISHGRIRLEIGAASSVERGGFPAPNQKLLAAGRPGTRQVLVDSVRGVTVWNVRLYGLNESSAVFQLTGYLSGSPDPAEGVRLLDEMLNTLELYAYPEPAPTPVPPDYSPAETWQKYAGRLEAGPDAYELRLRLPRGWWAYPDGSNWIDVTNWMVSDARAPALVPGAIKLSISGEPCAALGGCPLKPGWLNNNMPGTREISQSTNGDTLWLVRIYHGQARFTLSAILSGSEEQVQGGITVLNMLLRTLDIVP